MAHTALYVGQSPVGIDIVHQSKSAANIKRTQVRFKGKSGVSREGGTPEDDAENYYVVEL